MTAIPVLKSSAPLRRALESAPSLLCARVHTLFSEGELPTIRLAGDASQLSPLVPRDARLLVRLGLASPPTMGRRLPPMGRHLLLEELGLDSS